jgi:hypothetical protein
MLEYLALPAWNTPPTSVDSWVVELSETAGPVIVSRESSTVTWFEVAPLRLKAYVVVENGHASAINFELHALDPTTSTRAIVKAAEALGWEIHADEPGDEDDEDEEEDDDEEDVDG